ncbi:MAG: type II toxin-antitoxin system HicA family toxin [Acidobacteriota bacterium]|nr:type II toxin-antitoxin system HicA family toxin [Acidobacteriota bacterium]
MPGRRRLHPVAPDRAIRAFERAGGKLVRQKGGHAIIDADGWPRPVVIPMHRRDVTPGTLRGNIRTAGLTVEEFLKLL